MALQICEDRKHVSSVFSSLDSDLINVLLIIVPSIRERPRSTGIGQVHLVGGMRGVAGGPCREKMRPAQGPRALRGVGASEDVEEIRTQFHPLRHLARQVA